MNDVIQHQRLASGYVPGLSEAGGTLQPPSSTQLQNCTVIRTVGQPVGFYDIFVGGAGPEPFGIGGKFIPSPPLKAALAPGQNVCQTGRVIINERSVLGAAAPGATPGVLFSVLYGSQLSPPINNLIRVIGINALGAADFDFDFSIERVLDPGSEP